MIALPQTASDRGSRMKRTTTSSFGTGKRESHDSSAFYNRQLYSTVFAEAASKAEMAKIVVPEAGPWADQVYCASSHGRFSGAVESKLFKEFAWKDLPFLPGV
jgi:hypothetical protein